MRPHSRLAIGAVGALVALAGCGGGGSGSQVAQKPEGTYRVPSGAMLPTLKLGEIVTADQRTLKTRAPQLGEILLFHPPSTANGLSAQCVNHGQGVGHKQPCGAAAAKPTSELFIKRVVGVPGDRIAFVHGGIERDGHLASEPFVRPCRDPGACNFPEAITVPPATYFMAGDNRGASDDSRFWGPIRRSWIVGLVKPPH